MSLIYRLLLALTITLAALLVRGLRREKLVAEPAFNFVPCSIPEVQSAVIQVHSEAAVLDDLASLEAALLARSYSKRIAG